MWPILVAIVPVANGHGENFLQIREIQDKPHKTLALNTTFYRILFRENMNNKLLKYQIATKLLKHPVILKLAYFIVKAVS